VRSIKLPSWTEGSPLAPGSFLFRLLGLEPVAAPPHVFALDAEGLRYGRFGRQGGAGYVFEEQRAVALPAGVFHSGPLGGALREPEALGEAIEALLGGISGKVDHASLVLPDAWLRLAFLETNELPRGIKERDEVLRWRLKRTLPVRVEDLRLEAIPAATLPKQQEPQRWLLGFALEELIGPLEDAFAARHVWIGRIVNQSLALLPALAGPTPSDALWCLIKVHPDSYTLSFARGAELVLYRYRSLDPALPAPERGALVRRDLRLTRAFLEEQLPDEALSRVLLAAPREAEEHWLIWIESELGSPAEAVTERHLPVVTSQPLPWWELAPLLGAAYQEIP
jgi:hypothetical protein